MQTQSVDYATLHAEWRRRMILTGALMDAVHELSTNVALYGAMAGIVPTLLPKRTWLLDDLTARFEALREKLLVALQEYKEVKT